MNEEKDVDQTSDSINQEPNPVDQEANPVDQKPDSLDQKPDSVDKNPNFKDKLHNLWDDDRSYLQRLVLSLITVFAACFTFIFFGPVEITAFGQSSLVFNVNTALPVMAIFALIVCAIVSFLLPLLRGRIFNYLITAVFSVLICGYIQGNFLNGTLGALTGDSIKWQDQKGHMVLNLAIGFVIFIIPFLVLYFNKNIWKKVLAFVSAALIVMQSVALITIFTGSTVKNAANKSNYLTTKDMAAYSSKHNTLVFLLDRLDYDHIDQIMKQYPGFFSKLDGFTSYTNATSEHTRTKPAVNYMFTNSDQEWKIPPDQYYQDSWNYNNKNLLKDLKSANYTLDFYSQIDLLFGSGETVKNYVSNLSCNGGGANTTNLIKNLSYLSAYRYMPTALKPFFWCYTDDVNNNIYTRSPMYQIDETKYDHQKNFSVTDKTNYFKFYHFMGSHNPYTLNADGTRNAGKTDVISQTRGNFNILFRAFDKMRRLGIYKNSAIIITADHGEPCNDFDALEKANRIGFFYKPAGNAGTPLKFSHAPISFKNLPATFAKASGLDYHKYGTPVDEVGENAKVVRYFYKSVLKSKPVLTEDKVYTYEIDGDAAFFKNWKIINVQHPKYSYW